MGESGGQIRRRRRANEPRCGVSRSYCGLLHLKAMLWERVAAVLLPVPTARVGKEYLTVPWAQTVGWMVAVLTTTVVISAGSECGDKEMIGSTHAAETILEHSLGLQTTVEI